MVSADFLNLLATIVAFAVAILGIAIRHRFGKEPMINFDLKYFNEIPANYPPAIVDFLCRFDVNINDIFATMLDLADRDHLKTEQSWSLSEKGGDVLFERSEKGKDELAFFESNLLDYIFKKISLDGTVSFNNIHVRIQSNWSDFTVFFANWKKDIVEETFKYNLIERPRGNQIYLIGIYAFLVIGILLLLAGAYLSLLAIVMIILLINLKSIFRKRTLKGATDYAKWQAFKRFLNDNSNLEEADPAATIIWDKYLTYAVSLGIAHKITKSYNISLFKIENESKEILTVNKIVNSLNPFNY